MVNKGVGLFEPISTELTLKCLLSDGEGKNGRAEAEGQKMVS